MGTAKLRQEDVAKKFNLMSYMTLEEVMAYAKCGRRHVEEEVKKGNLRAYKPVRGLEFDPEEVKAWYKRKVVKR